MSRIPKTPKPTPRTPQKARIAAATEEAFKLGAWHGIRAVRIAWEAAHPDDPLDDIDAAIAAAIEELREAAFKLERADEAETGSTSG